MRLLYTTLIVLLIASSCNRVKDKTKDVINKGGETAGKGMTEFVEGFSEGVDRTLECELVLSDSLKAKGISTGKFGVHSDTIGNNNMLTMYLIFNKDFKGDVMVKAADKNGTEEGRTKLPISAKAGEAKFYDFVFDKRTYIEAKSKLVIE